MSSRENKVLYDRSYALNAELQIHIIVVLTF